MLGAAVGLEGLPPAMKKKVLSFDCSAEDIPNPARSRPEFLSVKKNFKSHLKGLLRARASGDKVKIYEIKTQRTFVDITKFAK